MANKTIAAILPTLINMSAGTRNSSGVDTTTAFGIPGSGLPRRHCNMNIYVYTIVCTDMSVYVALGCSAGGSPSSDGHIYQNVYGTTYICRMYAYTDAFEIYIPNGTDAWNDVQILNSAGTNIVNSVSWVVGYSSTNLTKLYNKDSYPFDWRFTTPVSLTVGNEYDESTITQAKDYSYTLSGASSASYSKSNYVYLGKLTDFHWSEDEQEEGNGYFYMCGGIVYPNSVVDSDIHATAVKITIPGIMTYLNYYPGDVTKSGVQKSCNRSGGYFRMKNNTATESLKVVSGWRDCKNCSEESRQPQTVFRNTGTSSSPKWTRCEETGTY